MWVVVGVAGLLVGAGAEPLCERSRVQVRRRRARYLLPGAMAVAWVLTASATPPGPAASAVGTAVRLVVVTLVVAAAQIDLGSFRLPDRLTVPAAGIALAAAVVVAAGPPHDVTALFAAVSLPAVLLTATLTVGGIGLGDVKLSIALGALLGLHGWGAVVTGFVLAWGSAAFVGVVLILRGAQRSTPIPLGPFLVGATLLAPFLV